MPSVPLPEQAPIQRAGWNTDFSGNVQMPNNERTPVNPILSGLNQASQQAQTALQGAQAQGALADVQQKQRGMQASMMGALANLPPDQFKANKANVIATINKLNPSFQYDPNLDQQTAKMNAMQGVPVQEQPAYQMQQFLNPLKQQQISQSFGDQQGQLGAPTGASTEGDIQTQDPRLKEGRVAALMGNKELADIDLETYKADPAIKAKQEEATKGGENLADAQKTFNVAASNLPRAMQRFQELRDASANASSGLGVNSEGEGMYPSLARAFEPETAKANQIIQQASKQGILAELGPQLQGLKGNKFLEGIANSASGLNAADPAKVKVNAVNGLQDQYIANLKSLAAQRRQYGDKNAPTDEQIDTEVAKYAPKTAAQQAQSTFGNNRGGQQNNSQGNAPIIKTQADFDKLPSGAAYIELDKAGTPHQVWKP